MSVANIGASTVKMKWGFGKKRGEFYLLSVSANRHA
jgi:hypothetical protein